MPILPQEQAARERLENVPIGSAQRDATTMTTTTEHHRNNPEWCGEGGCGENKLATNQRHKACLTKTFQATSPNNPPKTINIDEKDKDLMLNVIFAIFLSSFLIV